MHLAFPVCPQCLLAWWGVMARDWERKNVAVKEPDTERTGEIFKGILDF